MSGLWELLCGVYHFIFPHADTAGGQQGDSRGTLTEGSTLEIEKRLLPDTIEFLDAEISDSTL